MSQGSHASSACGELGEGEEIDQLFEARRRTGGHMQYHCTLLGTAETRWLPSDAVPPDAMAAWDLVVQANLRRDQEGRRRDDRKRLRDEAAQMEIRPFVETEVGKLVLSQRINTNRDAAVNRRPDCELAIKRMRDPGFLLYTARSSAQLRVETVAQLGWHPVSRSTALSLPDSPSLRPSLLLALTCCTRRWRHAGSSRAMRLRPARPSVCSRRSLTSSDSTPSPSRTSSRVARSPPRRPSRG